MLASFRPINFRALAADFSGSIREGQQYSPILVKANGEASYGHTRSDKDSIVASFDGGSDLLLMAWTGQYRTDIFHLTQGDLDAHFKSN
jgi:hypothetical protein